MLVNLKEILKIAEQDKSAIGMFNATGFDSLQAVISAAEELNKPVIIAHAEVHNVYNDISMVGPAMVAVAPAFIWSTFEDTVVPCDNSLRYAAAMKKAGVRFALHIYPFGELGLATSDNEISDYYGEPAVKHSRRWIDDCCDFFRIYTVEKY